MRTSPTSPLALLCALAAATAWAEGPLRIVATGGRMGHDSYTVAGSVTAFRHRTPHVLGGPVDEIQVGFMNWSHGYTAEVVSTNDITIDRAWLERDATGQIVPLTFDGGRAFTMPAYSQQAYFPADPIASSVWTGAPPARDDLFWVHVAGHVPTQGVVYLGCPVGWPGAKFVLYDPANDPGTFDMTGPVPTIAGANARNRGLPLVFTGRFSGPGHLSVIGIGDSILDGTGDSTTVAPVVSGFGFFNRAAVDADGGHAIAMFNLTRHGAASGVWNNPLRMPKFLPLANVVVEEFGTNDIGVNGTGDTGALKTRLLNLWARARAAGVQRVLRTQLLPRTDSTDQWATLTNQTPNTGWGEGGKRDALNAFFADMLASGKVDRIVGTLAAVSDPTDDHYWRTNGAPKYFNADSTHLNPAGNAALAPVLRAELLALEVDAEADTYDRWTNRVAWGGADAAPQADPDLDGLPNLLAYAYGLPPLVAAGEADRPAVNVDQAAADGPWLVYTYRRNALAGDVSYRVLTAGQLTGAWRSRFIDGIEAVEEVLDPDLDGDGRAERVRLKVKLPADAAMSFLQLTVGR